MLYMLPGLPINDPAYSGEANVNAPRNGSTCFSVGVGLSHLAYCLLRNLGHSVGRAALEFFWMKAARVMVSASHAVAGLGVVHIILMAPGKKMLSIAAWWVVARMPNQMRERIFSMLKEICNPRGPHGGYWQFKDTVAAWRKSAGPWPALIGTATINLLPEPANVAIAERWEWLTIGFRHPVLLIRTRCLGVLSRSKVSVPRLPILPKSECPCPAF